MDRGAWRATVYGGLKESDMSETTEHPRKHFILMKTFAFFTLSALLGSVFSGFTVSEY